MTLARFVQKNTFRNLRRSILTVLSIGFSLLLLTLMMAIGATSICRRVPRSQLCGW